MTSITWFFTKNIEKRFKITTTGYAEIITATAILMLALDIGVKSILSDNCGLFFRYRISIHNAPGKISITCPMMT